MSAQRGFSLRGFEGLTVLTVCQKVMASLVSFQRFAKTVNSVLKVVFREGEKETNSETGRREASLGMVGIVHPGIYASHVHLGRYTPLYTRCTHSPYTLYGTRHPYPLPVSLLG